MIVDSSALICILLAEPDSAFCTRALWLDSQRRVSAATYLETCIVIDSAQDPIGSRRLDDLLVGVGIVIEPVTEHQAVIARQAYRDFGKGSGHRARLNFGDCFAYALAKDKREPLLCIGSDFIHTDLSTLSPT